MGTCPPFPSPRPGAPSPVSYAYGRLVHYARLTMISKNINPTLVKFATDIAVTKPSITLNMFNSQCPGGAIPGFPAYRQII